MQHERRGRKTQNGKIKHYSASQLALFTLFLKKEHNIYLCVFQLGIQEDTETLTWKLINKILNTSY